MNRADFIAKIADRSNLSKKDAGEALDAIEMTLLEDVFAAEDSIRLKIGTFSGYTKETSARKARNPRTGETIDIPAKTMKGYPKFKPSKMAKE